MLLKMDKNDQLMKNDEKLYEPMSFRVYNEIQSVLYFCFDLVCSFKKFCSEQHNTSHTQYIKQQLWLANIVANIILISFCCTKVKCFNLCDDWTEFRLGLET